QNLPQLSGLDVVEQIRKGGYILAESADPVAVIVATGSELVLAMEAHQRLAEAGVPTRVVSMPCTNLFDRQTDAYQKLILPLTLPIVAVEAAHP
ncbi:transketolase-like TK C-terminal-containing protein, partial [Escherichia coli]